MTPKMLINKKTLKHLAELARIDLKAQEEKKLLKDLREILDYFEQLKELNTENVELLEDKNQTKTQNVFRDDKVDLDRRQKEIEEVGRIIGSFPETKEKFLKTPPVFE